MTAYFIQTLKSAKTLISFKEIIKLMQRNKIYVELSNSFYKITKTSFLSILLEEEEMSIKGVLTHLSKKYGEQMEKMLFEKKTGLIIPGLMVLLNGKIHTGVSLNEKDVQLKDGDRVSLLYFVSGG